MAPENQLHGSRFLSVFLPGEDRRRRRRLLTLNSAQDQRLDGCQSAVGRQVEFFYVLLVHLRVEERESRGSKSKSRDDKHAFKLLSRSFNTLRCNSNHNSLLFKRAKAAI